MLTLILVRHAKSDWGDLDLEDYERALAPRGIKAAPVIARELARLDLKPDLVLCSGAVRTRATLALMLPEFSSPPPAIRYDDELYLAAPRTLLDVLAANAKTEPHVMMIAHNPGLHALALELTGTGSRTAISDLAAKFPTAAVAVLRFDCKTWKEVRAGKGELMRFMTPRGLAAK